MEWPSHPIEPHKPICAALELEKSIFEDAQRLCGIADKHQDYALVEVISTRFLQKEAKHVKDMLKEVNRVSKSPGHGE